MAFDQTAYVAAYRKENYDRIYLQIPKGRKAEIKKEAKNRGLTINQFIVTAIEEHYGMDLSKI